MRTKLTVLAAALLLSTLNAQLSTVFAQGTAFTYQGRLNDGENPASGIYDLRFAIYDFAAGGAQQGNLLTNSATAVSNGLFIVTLDFGNQFPGADRWLEIGVRTNGSGAFSTLSPRQQITPAPYAIQSESTSNLLGVLPASQLGAGTAAINISGSAASFTGSMTGDVTGPQAATAVSTVGGVTSANVALGANAANAATSANAANAIVRRDGSGSFSAGGLTLSGNLNLPATTASTGIIKSGGVNLLHGFGSQNFFGGANAGNLTLSGGQNTGLGVNALFNNSSGSDNTGLGAFALGGNAGGNNNTASGANALASNTTGNNNTAHGAYALALTTNGLNNTASGFAALNGNTSGSGNTANGMHALRLNTTGSDNTASGRNTMLNNTTGSFNTASGAEALNNNNTGSANTASGHWALYSNTNGVNNTASGESALYNNTSGSQNTATGVGSLGANTSGSDNTAHGFNALAGNSTGTGNTANGYHALYGNGSGIENTADGGFALFLNAGGSRNTAVGYYSLGNNTTGSNNIALGDNAGSGITTGSGNIDIGHSGFSTDTNTIRIGSGQTKTFIAGIADTTIAGGQAVVVNGLGQLGTGFVGIGTTSPQVPLHIASDFNAVMLLHDTGPDSTQSGYVDFRNGSFAETAWVGFGTPGSPDFSIVNARASGDIILSPLLGNVGISRTPTANKLEVEGNASKTAAGSWLANSDARIKTGVQTVTGALDKLSQVRLVQFHYTEEYRAQHPSLEDRSYLNVVAQEFQKVFPDDVQSSGEKLPGGDDTILQVDTYPLTIYSAAAIQELNRKVEQKETEIAELKQRLEKLERLMNGKKGGGK